MPASRRGNIVRISPRSFPRIPSDLIVDDLGSRDRSRADYHDPGTPCQIKPCVIYFPAHAGV